MRRALGLIHSLRMEKEVLKERISELVHKEETLESCVRELRQALAGSREDVVKLQRVLREDKPIVETGVGNASVVVYIVDKYGVDARRCNMVFLYASEIGAILAAVQNRGEREEDALHVEITSRDLCIHDSDGNIIVQPEKLSRIYCEAQTLWAYSMTPAPAPCHEIVGRDVYRALYVSLEKK